MMDQEFTKNYRHIYFLGIGGISMSGLAEILNRDGFLISGSDMKPSAATDRLIALGISIHIGHKKENITDTIDLLVYTAAVKEDNPELVAAKEKGIKIIDRAKLLGLVMANYKKSVAISGTHGKTTTTAMISEILLAAQLDPTISVGGILNTIAGNTRVGSSPYFVAEACEYFDSFLKFNPYIGIILNIEADHLDYFKNLENIRNSFTHFAGRIAADGAVILHSDIWNYKEICQESHCQMITFGLDPNTSIWCATNILPVKNGGSRFTVTHKGASVGEISLQVPGEHNITNALAAIACCQFLGVPMESIADALSKFQGVNRRFQKKGSFQGVTVIDDYAHHPSEIQATLKAARQMADNRIFCVFQPHTYSRTKALLNQFAISFVDCDQVIISDIYAAREKDTGEINGNILAEKIQSHSQNAIYMSDFSRIISYLKENCTQGDLLITMGAGDIYLLGESLVTK